MHQLTVVIGALVALARAEEGSAASYTAPAAGANVLLLETFQDDWASRWVASKKEVYSGKFETQPYALDALAGDVGLVMAHKAHRYGLSRKLAAPVEASTQPLVVQYEVSLKNGLECGGAYLKLLNVDASFDGDAFEEPTPYSIMFGPDKCANAGKVHFIFKFKNPTTGEWVEHHLKDGPRMPPSADRVVQVRREGRGRRGTRGRSRERREWRAHVGRLLAAQLPSPSCRRSVIAACLPRRPPAR
jgi:calnexin